MKVVEMNNLAKKQQETEKQNMLNTIDEVRQKIEKGELSSFVVCSMRTDDEVEITACVKDRLDAIGLIEVSKMILFSNAN